MTASGTEMESRARAQAEEAQARLREQGRQMQYRARQGAENVRESVATGMHAAAQRIRQQAPETPRPNLVMRLAEPLDRGADYLQGHNWPQIGNDLRTAAREHPGWAAAGVFVTAFLLGRLMRRR